MVSNAPVSECHRLALPAHVKPAHWSKLRATRGTRGGASAKSEPVSRVHIPAQEIRSGLRRGGSEPKKNGLES